MNNLQNNEINTISTREVAEMMDTKHDLVLRKLNGRKDSKGIIDILRENQMDVSDYFIESSYKVEGNNKTYSEYLCTKLGCDFLGNKFSGEKGIIFTAKYVKRFEEMKTQLKQDSFMIADPIERAKRWIQEQEEKKVIEQELIHTKKTLGIVVTNNITFDMFNKELNKLINIAANTIKSDVGKTYSAFYTFINNKLSINLTSRQNNKIKKLNEEHFKKKGKYYSDSTLKTKASKLSCIKENEYEQVLSIAKSFIVDNGGDITNYNKLVVYSCN